MTRIAISVEGYTEHDFVRGVLAEYLLNFQVFVHSVILSTKTAATGERFKGGSANIDRASREVGRLIHNFDFVTTLYDFYGFGGKGPGQTIADLTDELHSRTSFASNFLPYFQQYEFEALLFSEPIVVAAVLGEPGRAWEVAAVRQAFATPEEINDNPITAPSKRLEAIFPQYDKRVHGPLIAQRIGVTGIRNECPRFNTWLQHLESVAPAH